MNREQALRLMQETLDAGKADRPPRMLLDYLTEHPDDRTLWEELRAVEEGLDEAMANEPSPPLSLHDGIMNALEQSAGGQERGGGQGRPRHAALSRWISFAAAAAAAAAFVGVIAGVALWSGGPESTLPEPTPGSRPIAFNIPDVRIEPTLPPLSRPFQQTENRLGQIGESVFRQAADALDTALLFTPRSSSPAPTPS